MSVRSWLGLALLGLLTVSSVRSYTIISPATLLVEFGTYNASDRICFDKIILKAALSPVLFNFNNPTNTDINYIKAEQLQHRRGGISADIVGGQLRSSSVTLRVSAFQGKKFFSNDVRVEMMCSPTIDTTGTTSTTVSTSDTTTTESTTTTTESTTTTTESTTTTTTQAPVAT